MPTSNRSKGSKETNNELQKTANKTQRAISELYPPIIDEVANVATWDNVLKEVKKIFKKNNYSDDLTSLVLDGSIAGTNIGLGGALAIANVESLSDYYLHTTYKGSKLSEALRDSVREAELTIANIVKQQLKFKTNWQTLTKEITKKTNTVGDVASIITELSDTGSKFIKGKLTVKEQQQFKKAVNSAQKYVDNLSPKNAPTKQLKKAYQGVIDSVIEKDQVLLENALTKAFNEKINYNNARISRTELSRAYSLSFQRQIEEDDIYIGYRFLLSSAHPRPDQCDCMANVDNGGGRGVFIKGDKPTVPVHPHCLCMLEPYVDKGQKLPKTYTQKSAVDYLDSLDDKTRGQIIGVNNAKYKNRYSDGLEKRGIHPDSFPKRNMLPKSLVTEGVS